MHDHIPSKTALRTAMRRAAHQIVDDPKILDDLLAVRILGDRRVKKQRSWVPFRNDKRDPGITRTAL